jgi:hypothetical protein
MISPRLTKKQDMRKPLNSRGSTGVGPSEGPKVIDNWARSGDATKRPEFDHGLQRKPKKLRPKWPF